jgi:hypothetical protein
VLAGEYDKNSERRQGCGENTLLPGAVGGFIAGLFFEPRSKRADKQDNPDRRYNMIESMPEREMRRACQKRCDAAGSG